MTLLILLSLLLSPSLSAIFGHNFFSTKPGPLSLPLEVFPYKRLQHVYFSSTPHPAISFHCSTPQTLEKITGAGVHFQGFFFLLAKMERVKLFLQ